MSVGQQLPLGQRIPDTLHAVSVSMPTMDDVIGYEEKRPDTLAKLNSGYPRFVVHEYLRKIEAHWQRLFECRDKSIWLTSSEKMAKALDEFLDIPETKYIRHRGVSGLRIPSDNELNLKAKGFLQHVGGFLPTRQAEDYLFSESLISETLQENTVEHAAEEELIATLSPYYSVDAANIILSNTGMNAFYSTFEAINEIQAPKGKLSWIKLGWLYTDTMHILDKLGHEHRENVELLNVLDIESLESVLENRSQEIAAIVTEAPTNPLIQTMDLKRIRELATKHEVLLVVDPTVASVANVDVAPFSDIIVNSLTKYVASEGDVIMGAVAVMDNCPEKEELIEKIRHNAETPYHRDVARTALQIRELESVAAKINENTAKVVAFLDGHSMINKVYWAREQKSATNFEKIARSPKSLGCLISFELNCPIAEFYDKIPLPKGPSFGMRSSLLCPYIYLAHYSLVTSEAGQAKLAEAKIRPDLIRFSVGTEPANEIIAALATALA